MDHLRRALDCETSELNRLQSIRRDVLLFGWPVFRLLRLIFINHRIRKATRTVQQLATAYGCARP
jgi:hypothetical protein